MEHNRKMNTPKPKTLLHELTPKIILAHLNRKSPVMIDALQGILILAMVARWIKYKSAECFEDLYNSARISCSRRPWLRQTHNIIRPLRSATDRMGSVACCMVKNRKGSVEGRGKNARECKSARSHPRADQVEDGCPVQHESIVLETESQVVRTSQGDSVL